MSESALASARPGPQAQPLSAGGRLLVWSKRSLPLVAIEAFLPPGPLGETAEQAGLARLTGALLSEGCEGISGPQLADQLEGMGAELGTGAAGASLVVPSAALERGLELLLRCLFRPTFPQPAFEAARGRQLAAIAAAAADPASVAGQTFSALVYGDHPYGRPSRGTRETLAELTREDCALFARRFFQAGGLTIAIAGDVDPRAIGDQLEAALAPYRGAAEPAPTFPAPPAREPRGQRLELPEITQRHLMIGHLGVRRTDPDYPALELLDHILGLGAGFTDRLSRVIRDELGLAYTVHGAITPSARSEPGALSCYLATTPEHEARAAAAVIAELARLRDEPVAADELEDARAYLSGSFPFRFETVRQLARYLIAWDRYRLGEYHLSYPDQLAAVSVEQIQAVARRHIDPQRLVHVVAGAREEHP